MFVFLKTNNVFSVNNNQELVFVIGISIVLVSILPLAMRVIEAKEWCRSLIYDIGKIFYTRSTNWRYSLAPIRAIIEVNTS